MANATAEKNPLSVLDGAIRTKNTEIRIVRSWEVGQTKTTIVKFNLAYEDASFRLLPRELREGKDRHQQIEEGRHVDYAKALGKDHKTVSGRVGDRPTDTADEKMETPRNGQASAISFWSLLQERGIEFVDGEYFKYTRRDGSVSLVIEIKFVARDKKAPYLEALKATGITPTPFSFELREKLLKNLFRRRWFRCFAFSNSAHIEPSKTYNFTGKGFPDKPLFELIVDDKGRVTFVEVPSK